MSWPAMRQHLRVEAGDWWRTKASPGLQDKAPPDDLLDDFKQMVAAEECRSMSDPAVAARSASSNDSKG